LVDSNVVPLFLDSGSRYPLARNRQSEQTGKTEKCRPGGNADAGTCQQEGEGVFIKLKNINLKNPSAVWVTRASSAKKEARRRERSTERGRTGAHSSSRSCAENLENLSEISLIRQEAARRGGRDRQMLKGEGSPGVLGGTSATGSSIAKKNILTYCPHVLGQEEGEHRRAATGERGIKKREESETGKVFSGRLCGSETQFDLLSRSEKGRECVTQRRGGEQKRGGKEGSGMACGPFVNAVLGTSQRIRGSKGTGISLTPAPD